MRAIRYHEHGGPTVLGLEEVAKPEPKADEVLVNVHASSVNPVDVYLREGETHTPEALPTVPGSDFAGIIEAVGSKVTEFSSGDRVHGAGLSFHQYGTNAKYVSASVDLVAHLPDEVGFVEGAAIGHVGVTAWSSVVQLGSPIPLDTVLIHGGSGGIGHVAVQLAKTVGARVITTAGSPERRARVEELGANFVLDYARDDLTTAITDVADAGVDVVVDHRPEDYLGLDIDVAANDGQIILIDGYHVQVENLRKTRAKDVTITGMGAFSTVPSVSDVVGRLSRLMAKDELTVEVARTIPLEDVRRAHELVMNESYVGKVVLNHD